MQCVVYHCLESWSVSREPSLSRNIASDLCACFMRYSNCFVICTGQIFGLLGPIMMVAPLLN